MPARILEARVVPKRPDDLQTPVRLETLYERDLSNKVLVPAHHHPTNVTAHAELARSHVS